ncbi:MAG: PIN domain-containing protein [Chthoniobacteraceae bacterium]
MGLILDSSPLIAAEKGKFDLKAFLSTRDEPVVLAAITASELLHGVHRAPDAHRRSKRLTHVEWVLSKFDAIPFALEEARHHARIWAELSSSGRSIGSHDLLIAATALSLGFTLATLNFDEFARVPGLMLVEENVLRSFQLA